MQPGQQPPPQGGEGAPQDQEQKRGKEGGEGAVDADYEVVD